MFKGKLDTNITKVVNDSGWSREHAKQKMNESRDILGVRFSDYAKYQLWKYDDPSAQMRVLEAAGKKFDKNITRTVIATGWSRPQAKANMNKVKDALGTSFSDYVALQLWKYDSLEEQNEIYQRRLKKRESRARAKERDNKKYLEKVIETTGWDRSYAETEVGKVCERTGCTVKEYFIYRFYELPPEKQDEILVVSLNKQIVKKYAIDDMIDDILVDKAATNRTFAELIHRPWCVNREVTLEEFNSLFKDVDRIIYKPVDGHRGQGIRTYDFNEVSREEAYDDLKDRVRGVVEAYLVQHHKLMELAPGSVNTTRIVTISTDEFADVVYASLRIGSGTSVVDNFHSGGMTANIDMETGKLVTDGTDQEGNVFKVHPYTGVTIRGFEVPYIKEAIEGVKKTIREKKIRGYLGWDIAMSEDGPELIEINLAPGIVLLQTPYAPEHKGMKYVLERYL